MAIDKIVSIGGARIGWVNATWPFAFLTATRDKLDLNATLIGRYTFSPDQVISIDNYSIIPLLGWGIQIQHNVPTYPKKIVFWCLGSPGSLIRRIEETGFRPKADPVSVPPYQGIPVRGHAIAVIIVLWNLLFIMDGGFTATGPEPGIYVLLATLLLFIGSIAVWWVPWLQRIIFKPGRNPGEIRAWLYLFTLIGGIMSIVIFVYLLTGFM